MGWWRDLETWFEERFRVRRQGNVASLRWNIGSARTVFETLHDSKSMVRVIIFFSCIIITFYITLLKLKSL